MKTKMLILSVVTILVLLISSCAPQTPTAPPPPTAVPATDTPVAIKAVVATDTAVPAVAASKYKEAPMLADLVKAGKLPTVDKRLPDTPLTTKPVESVGKYGGTLHLAATGADLGNIKMFFMVEAPIKWKADITGYEPALIESYEWNTDGTVFTMHMRKGLKWSDGEPYTSADWKFYWEDYAKNPDQKIYTIPAYLRKSDGTPIDMQFPDDYTVVWKSDKAQWIAPYYMAQGFWEFADRMMVPAHYMKQFHPKYTPGKTWADYEKATHYEKVAGFPCLMAWCTSDVSSDGSRITYSRNPYYWRVDTDGNQLPYIDKIEATVITDEQTRILSCTQGKFDVAFRECGGPNEIPLLQANAQAGNFHLLQGYMNGAGAWPGYMVNQWYVEGGKNYADDTPEHAKEIRDLLRDSRFRKALSKGIDRQRMIEVAWNGVGTAKGVTISPQSWHFASPQGQQVYKEWAASDATFDAAAANKLLDDVGMKKGADGMRTLPSGKDFTMTVDVTDWGGSLKVQTDMAAEAKAQWEKNLGIKVEIKNMQGQPDVDTRTNEGYYMLRGAHISEIDIWTFPDWIFPVVNRYAFPLEGRYYAQGKEACKVDATTHLNCGVKPEAGSPAEKLQAIYDKGLVEPDIDKRHQLVWDAIKILETEGPFVIGISGDQHMPIYIKNNVHNVLDFGVVGPWAPATPGNQILAQWWMEQ